MAMPSNSNPILKDQKLQLYHKKKIRRDSRQHPLSEWESDHPSVPTDVVTGTKIPLELDANLINSHLIQSASTGYINRNH